MTIRTVARLLELCQLVLNRNNLGIGRLFVVFVARRADRNRHVGRQSPQRACARDIDVARRAFHDVLALAAFMAELRRLPLWPIDRDKRS